jgi:hypothetical protein
VLHVPQNKRKKVNGMISCDRGKHENGSEMMNLASLAIPVDFQ